MFLNCERNFKRGNLPEMEVRAHMRGCVLRRFIAVAVKALQVLIQEEGKELFSRQPTAVKRRRRTYRMVDLTGGYEFWNAADGYFDVKVRDDSREFTFHFNWAGRMQVLR